MVEEEEWIPRTRLGRLVKSGVITSIDEVFAKGYIIREVEIVDTLLPNLDQELINVKTVQRQTDAGELTRFQVVVCAGDREKYVGIGIGKSPEYRIALQKAIKNAKLNIRPVIKGCGAWECGCGAPHSVPLTVVGKSGSVRVKLIPAPRGTGLVIGDTGKIVLSMAGIKDVRSHAKGHKRNKLNYALAVFDALKKIHLYSGALKRWTI